MWQGHRLTGRNWPTGTDIAYKLATNTRYGKKRERVIMSGVLWCEANGWEKGHPFSDKDPGVQTFNRSVKVSVPRGNSYGRAVYQDEERVTEEFHICGPCAIQRGLFQPDHEEIRDALTGDPGHYDPAYVDKLEKELDRLNTEKDQLRDQ